ncbi:MAG TPA: hypothetical protein VIL37_06655 [Natronosporangium sp.]
MPSVQLRPISEADIPAVAAFLHTHLNRRVSPAAWARAIQVPWKVDAPNHGFLLRDRDDAVVGVYLAYYAERPIDGRLERFCNLGAWCVLPEHRFHGLRLLKALLAQEGYHFTDLSPSGSVVGINARLGFQRLDSTTAVIPNLPWPSWPGRVEISADPAVIEATLTGPELELYRDQAGAAGARHLVIRRGDRWCYVILRRDRRKRLPIFASILYVSDPELFRELVRPLTRHLLLRWGVLATLAELRVVKHRPAWSVRMAGRPKMFRSDRLGPDQIDNLYSELVCLAW